MTSSIYGHDCSSSNVLEETGSIILGEQQIYRQKTIKEHHLRLCRIAVRGSAITKLDKSAHALNEDTHLRTKIKSKMK